MVRSLLGVDLLNRIWKIAEEVVLGMLDVQWIEMMRDKRMRCSMVVHRVGEVLMWHFLELLSACAAPVVSMLALSVWMPLME